MLRSLPLNLLRWQPLDPAASWEALVPDRKNVDASPQVLQMATPRSSESRSRTPVHGRVPRTSTASTPPTCASSRQVILDGARRPPLVRSTATTARAETPRRTRSCTRGFTVASVALLRREEMAMLDPIDVGVQLSAWEPCVFSFVTPICVWRCHVQRVGSHSARHPQHHRLQTSYLTPRPRKPAP